jgi:type I restriction enzyme S subunit
MNVPTIKLGEVAVTTSGGTPRRGHKLYFGGNIPWVKSGDLPDGEIIEIQEQITSAGLENSNAKIHDAGTLLIAMYGATVGKLGILRFPAATNQAICAITPDSRFDSWFLFYWLLSIRRNLIEASFGAAQPNISQAILRDLDIPLIAKSKQHQIVRKLHGLFAQLESTRAAVKCQVREANQVSKRLREHTLKAIEGIARVRLDDLLFDIEAGKSFQTSDRFARENELGVLKVSAVSWSEFKPREAKALTADYIPDERHRVRGGDVLISRANTVELVGAVVRVGHDYPNRLLSDKTLRLVLNEDRCDPNYIVQILRLPEARAHFENNATGTSDSMRNITQDTICATPIPIMKKGEQQKIAARLEAVDKAISSLRKAAQAQLSDLSILPSRFLDAVFEN